MIEAQPNREMYGKTLSEMGAEDSRIVVFEAGIAKSTNTWRLRDRSIPRPVFPGRHRGIEGE